MDGNLVSIIYYNMGEIGDWENFADRSGVWPKGSGHTYIDGVAIIVQAETTTPDGTTIHPLETNYYEYTRYDQATGVTYGWWALPGYDNPFYASPARSDDMNTWPESWPDRLSEWDGAWNGFFGKGVQNADLETYFVFDDNEDREYILGHNFHPDKDDPDRGGLGMQVKARGFQWSQVLAEDVVFWFYEITNMSTTDYEKVLFGQYVDWGIGGHDNSSNNAGDFNELLDISYAWSTVAFGSPGNWSPVGLAGYAFLESPGISDDIRDNDVDGLTDELRTNEADLFVESPTQDPFLRDVFQDTTRFKDFYGYSWRPHWDADENANWDSYHDLDDNGQWDPGENLKDDVGTDGIGPFDDGYTGPDIDGTEANGKPDQGEPDFGILDKDESDQLGLTGFKIFSTHTYDLNNDENNWGALASLPTPSGGELVGVNLANYFSSYLFHLNGRDSYSVISQENQETGETERFSMAMIFGIDKDDLFRRKKTVQSIYNANYRFAKPPDKPIIKAIPGDKRVTLFWDDGAEQTWDAFYQKYNFEGYRVYRSTEPNFLESRLITDAYGKATFRKPIAQFDLVNGVKGLHPVHVNGAMFNLGDDTGLKHSFIDSTVQNGQTYYYAVVAYDQGYLTETIEGSIEGIPPSETATIIKMDVNGQIQTDVNTAVVVPRSPGAGYIAPKIQNFIASGPGTGTLDISILDADSIRHDHTYLLEFEDSTNFNNNPKPFYRLIDKTENDTLINLTQFESDNVTTKIMDGFSINIENDSMIVIDWEKTDWITGNSNHIVDVGFDSRYAPGYQSKRVNFPADFEVILKEHGEGDLSFPATQFSQPIQSNIIVNNLTDNIEHYQFIFRDENEDEMFNAGDAIFFVMGDSANTTAEKYSDATITWSVSFIVDTTIADEDQIIPQPGDRYLVSTTKSFRKNEGFQFTTSGAKFDVNLAKNKLSDVAVVPNPYVGAASWENNTNVTGRGDRLIYFINLPNQCTIRIYTMSGKLIKVLEHDSTFDDGEEPWNLVTDDGTNISYGIYMFHIDAPDVGETIGKFAVIK